ncbi:hypothetical protein BD414DRAFT_466024 [Trametes punicea]|nr:hypothetical protein BD414DRAFT_466024 [Trametes punicea]
MFFCRHFLLRAPAQRHFASLLTTRNSSCLFASIHKSPLPGHVNYSRTAAPLPRDSDAPNGSDQDTASTPTPIQPSETTINPPSTTSGASTEKRKPTSSACSNSSTQLLSPATSQDGADPVADYLAVRSRGQDALMTSPSELFARAIWRCVHDNMSEHFPSFVQDAILITDVRPSKIRGRIVIEILLSTMNVRRMLSRTDIIALLRCLERNRQLRFLRSTIRILLARHLAKVPLDEQLDRDILVLLVPLLLEKLETLTDKHLFTREWASTDELESTDRGVAVPRVLWPLYQIALRLALIGLRPEASELLAKLVDRQCIDPQAINATDLSSTNFVYVMLSVFVRTCLKYGWFSRATKLLLTAAPREEKISRPFAQLIEDWMVSALTKPRQNDLENAASLIILLFQRAEDHVLSSKLLLDFYDAALELGLPELAQTVYGHSRDVKHHSYPTPRDLTLLRMMVHFHTKSHNIHLARVLARQVVDEKIPLHPSVRAPFIAHVAVLGFATEARTLWERYSTGRDALYVVANGKTMLRMTSLFMRSADQVAQAAAKRGPSNGSATRRENRDDKLSDDQHQTPAADGEDDPPASDAPDSLSTPPPHHSLSSEQQPLNASAHPEVGIEELGTRGFDALTYSELLEREADLRRFADRVFDMFYQTKLPLERAAHYDLNTLARGASVVRRESLTMDIFLFMKKHDIRMDMRDVNVALGVLAKSDPVTGAKYIERMIESGLHPDAVSFGTVIHWAAQHGDARLVKSLIERGRESGVADLSFKTLSSLLHAAVQGKLSGDKPPAARLQYAEEIVETMLMQGSIPTPNVARDCITAALHAQDPAKAYEFWKRYIKGKVEWEDSAHDRLRELIMNQVRAHTKRRWLEREQAQVMLYDLGTPEDVPFVMARHRVSPGFQGATQPKSDEKAKGPEGG